MNSLPALLTNTLVVVDAVNTGAPVKAGVLFTVIYILLAVSPSEAKVTGTSKASIRLADTHAMLPAHIGGDELYPARLCVVRL